MINTLIKFQTAEDYSIHSGNLSVSNLVTIFTYPIHNGLINGMRAIEELKITKNNTCFMSMLNCIQQGEDSFKLWNRFAHKLLK